MITGKDCMLAFGLESKLIEAKHMTLWDVPPDLEIKELPNRVYTNKAMVKPLSNAFRELIKTGAVNELRTWDGCYNPRPIRGYEKKFYAAMMAKDYELAAKYCSIHWWGCAVDVNAAWNQLGQTPSLSPLFVSCFTRSGFDWGGYFSRRDGMHFQLATLSPVSYTHLTLPTSDLV